MAQSSSIVEDTLSSIVDSNVPRSTQDHLFGKLADKLQLIEDIEQNVGNDAEIVGVLQVFRLKTIDSIGKRVQICKHLGEEANLLIKNLIQFHPTDIGFGNAMEVLFRLHQALAEAVVLESSFNASMVKDIRASIESMKKLSTAFQTYFEQKIALVEEQLAKDIEIQGSALATTHRSKELVQKSKINKNFVLDFLNKQYNRV